MNWIKETREELRERKNALFRAKWLTEREWHPWFAWRPVDVAPDRSAWLTIVERRLDWQYRDPQPQWYEWDIRRSSTGCARTNPPHPDERA